MNLQTLIFYFSTLLLSCISQPHRCGLWLLAHLCTIILCNAINYFRNLHRQKPFQFSARSHFGMLSLGFTRQVPLLDTTTKTNRNQCYQLHFCFLSHHLSLWSRPFYPLSSTKPFKTSQNQWFWHHFWFFHMPTPGYTHSHPTWQIAIDVNQSHCNPAES